LIAAADFWLNPEQIGNTFLDLYGEHVGHGLHPRIDPLLVPQKEDHDHDERCDGSPSRECLEGPVADGGPLPPVPVPAPPGPPSFPSLRRQDWNYTKADVRHIADGGREVDEATRLERSNICYDCHQETFLYYLSYISCIAKKTEWASEFCPKGK
jgi:hypothetical protein